MFRKLIVLALAAMFLAPAFTFAQSLTWKIQSFDQKIVDVQFYSTNRKHVWPSNNRVYTVKDYGVHTYKLSCIENEKICYGAWVRGKASSYWGKGKDGRQGCNDCCYTCNGGTTPIRKLND